LISFAIAAGIFVWFVNRVLNPPAAVTGNITREFTESLPSVGPADGILETATANVPETFSQTDSAWLFNTIPLGTTVSEIRVPAVYRYHVRIFEPWKLETRGQICLVLAPQFEPSLPPAILTDRMEKSTSAGWLRFDADQSLANLEKGITGELAQRANDKTHRDYVREACRESVAEFVRAWLKKENYWRPDKFYDVIVKFPDEIPGGDLNNVHVWMWGHTQTAPN
jgi:hypothetical protein